MAPGRQCDRPEKKRHKIMYCYVVCMMCSWTAYFSSLGDVMYVSLPSCTRRVDELNHVGAPQIQDSTPERTVPVDLSRDDFGLEPERAKFKWD